MKKSRLRKSEAFNHSFECSDNWGSRDLNLITQNQFLTRNAIKESNFLSQKGQFHHVYDIQVSCIPTIPSLARICGEIYLCCNGMTSFLSIHRISSSHCRYALVLLPVSGLGLMGWFSTVNIPSFFICHSWEINFPLCFGPLIVCSLAPWGVSVP